MPGRMDSMSAPELGLMMFSTDQASRLTGLSKRRLGYWATTDFYTAEHGADAHRVAFGRVYSFLDLVALRTIALLVNKHRVHLSELRRVANALSDRRGNWAGWTFYVRARRVYWQATGTPDIFGTRYLGQIEMPIEMDKVIRDARNDIDEVRKRGESDIAHIVRNRWVAQRRWVMAGTRVPTSAIWDFHAAGYDAAAIVREYPRLRPKDVEAAIVFEEKQRQEAS
ncbi:MAG: DUF433 domain-containing protein [Candidatus Dormibacteraceae bacterium]